MEPALQITITLTADGQLGMQATGPAADNKLLLLGALELVKATVTKQMTEPAQPARPNLLIARGGLPPINGHR